MLSRLMLDTPRSTLPLMLWELSVAEQRYRAVLEVRTDVPLEVPRSPLKQLMKRSRIADLTYHRRLDT